MKTKMVILLASATLAAGFLIGRGTTGRDAGESAARSGLAVNRVRERTVVAETASRGSGRALLGEIRRSSADKLAGLMFRAIECPDPIEKELLMAECLVFMETSNWKELLGAFSEATGATGRDQYGAWKNCLMRSGQVAGEQAMTHWRELGLGGLSDEPWHTMYGWASIDPAAARQWLDQCEAEGEPIPTSLYQALVAGAGLYDSKTTMNLLASLPEERRETSAGHLVWNLTARGGLEELKPWLEYAREHADDPELAGLAGSLRGEIERKFMWAATSSGRADLALQHLDYLATEPGDLPPLAQRVLSGFEGAKAPQGLDLVAGLMENPRYAGLPDMEMLQRTALEQMQDHDPGGLDAWLRRNQGSPLRPAIEAYQRQSGRQVHGPNPGDPQGD
jgi:hypothetical protein